MCYYGMAHTPIGTRKKKFKIIMSELKEKIITEIKKIIDIPSSKFSRCWPLNVIGEPDIIPRSFKKAIIDPEKVIAPIAPPIDISIRLAILILPGNPRLKAWGFKKADIATKTAARPTRLWKPATNSGIAVIGIL